MELTEYELNNRLSEGTEYDVDHSKRNLNKNLGGENFNVEETLDALDDNDQNAADMTIPKLPIKFIVIDCSPINFIDTVGIKSIKQVNMNELERINTKF